MSRKKAKAAAKGRSLNREMENKGVYVKASSYATMAEEMPEAYKNVSHVVDAVDGAGISKKVVKLRAPRKRPGVHIKLIIMRAHSLKDLAEHHIQRFRVAHIIGINLDNKVVGKIELTDMNKYEEVMDLLQKTLGAKELYIKPEIF